MVVFAVAGWAWLNRTSEAVSSLNTELQQFREAGQGGDVLIEQSGQDAIDAIKRLPGLALPNGATDVHFARQGQTHAIYWLRFHLPAGATDTFLRSTCFPRPLADGVMPEFEYEHNPDVVANLDWWGPERLTKYGGATCNPSPDVTFRIVADESNSTSWTSYLEISTN